MQMGKFTFQNRKWYYNDRQLANPFIIIWKIIWFIPVIVSLTIFAFIVTVFSMDISEFERVWKEHF